MFSNIYSERNFAQGRYPILIHLFEVYSNLGRSFAKNPTDFDVTRKMIPKCFAWYCGLSQQLGLIDLEQVMWSKYPYACPYCLKRPCVCGPILGKLDEAAMLRAAQENARDRPNSLDEWQAMFSRIYGERNSKMRPAEVMAKILEELGELSEAIRI